MRKIKLVILFIGMFFLPIIVLAQNISDYIIMQDIGSYVRMAKVKDFRTLELKTIPGYTIINNSGVLMGADHLFFDHDDKTYESVYESDVTDLGVKVQVTQHAGADSDKWLLHELEDGYRSSKTLNATYSAPNPVRIINNNKIWFQWGAYSWLSNNVVVNIEYTDLEGTKSEPLEVVQAYLSKFPSSMTLSNDEAKANAHNVQWIKDEMERRLWLCDKWSMQLQLGKVSQADMLQALVKNMTIFLNYRQKYFGVSATDDIIALNISLQANDGTSIKKKLDEYKTWWTKHKEKKISL